MNISVGDLQLNNCDVDIIMERYTRRDFQPNREGDDIHDVGRKSYEIIVRGNIDLEKFKLLNSEANKKVNRVRIQLGEFDVVCKRLEYSSNGDFKLHLLEDVMPEDHTDEESVHSKANVYISDPLIDYNND
jgi:hypothetical protein